MRICKGCKSDRGLLKIRTRDFRGTSRQPIKERRELNSLLAVPAIMVKVLMKERLERKWTQGGVKVMNKYIEYKTDALKINEEYLNRASSEHTRAPLRLDKNQK